MDLKKKSCMRKMLKKNHAEQRNKLVPKENNVQGQDSWQGENGLPPPSLFYVVY